MHAMAIAARIGHWRGAIVDLAQRVDRHVLPPVLEPGAISQVARLVAPVAVLAKPHERLKFSALVTV
mgnify:CR=1 FL=1